MEIEELFVHYVRISFAITLTLLVYFLIQDIIRHVQLIQNKYPTRNYYKYASKVSWGVVIALLPLINVVSIISIVALIAAEKIVKREK